MKSELLIFFMDILSVSVDQSKLFGQPVISLASQAYKKRSRNV